MTPYEEYGRGVSLLVDDLPKQAAGLPVCTDYRRMVLFETLLFDPELSGPQKVLQGLELLYGRVPADWQRAWQGLLWYYRCGAVFPPPGPEEGRRAKRAAPLYDFEQDAGPIYAAFRQVYGVDLQTEPLHWWAFRAMLLALPDGCQMGRLMQIRAADTDRLKGKERERYRRLQRQYAVRRGAGSAAALSLAERESALQQRLDARYREAQQWLEQKTKQNGR